VTGGRASRVNASLPGDVLGRPVSGCECRGAADGRGYCGGVFRPRRLPGHIHARAAPGMHHVVHVAGGPAFYWSSCPISNPIRSGRGAATARTSTWGAHGDRSRWSCSATLRQAKVGGGHGTTACHCDVALTARVHCLPAAINKREVYNKGGGWVPIDANVEYSSAIPSHPIMGSPAVTRVGHPEAGAGAGSLDVLDVYDDHVLCVASAPDTPPRVVVRRPDPSRDVDIWVNVTVCAPLRVYVCLRGCVSDNETALAGR
jgi:hypothetical protein